MQHAAGQQQRADNSGEDRGGELIKEVRIFILFRTSSLDGMICYNADLCRRLAGQEECIGDEPRLKEERRGPS